jgi:hypothetical protein
MSMQRALGSAMSAAIGLLVIALPSVGRTQAVKPKPAPPAAAQAEAKLPDWGGLWEGVFSRGAARPENPTPTPPYAARQQAYREAQQRGDIQDTPAANCVPPGMPGVMTQPYPLEILFTPGKVTILIEAYSQWRQIFTDGRTHPDDPDLTFNGHSIGQWEGDTLVADTVGFTTDTTIAPGTYHSAKMHIVERMHLTAPDTLTIETTVEDPEALAKPWTTTRNYGRHRDWTLAEYVCQQNNRNFLTEDGKAGVRLK